MIVQEGNSIYAQIGSATLKISKVLAQAENWYQDNVHLLERCGIHPADGSLEGKSRCVETSELVAAVQSAKANISIDIDEAVKLKDMLKRITLWREQVALIAPKRSKRNGKATRSKFSVDDLIGLIEESAALPINTADEVNRLQIQLSTVEAWRSEASSELENIVGGFHQLQTYILSVYGEPKEFSIDRFTKANDSEDESENSARGDNEDDAEMDEGSYAGETASDLGFQGDTDDDNSLMPKSGAALDVLRQIKELQDGARDIGLVTSEGELGDLLDAVAKWCIRSFKYLNSPREIFDKRFYGAFDRFLSDGESLREKSRMKGPDIQSNELSERLGNAWGVIVSDQLERLHLLKVEREKFKEWCALASLVLSDEKKLTVEKLADLAQKSRNFPASTCILLLL
jgi:hypothetical protein